MPKRPSAVKTPDIALAHGAPEPLYRQLYDRLRAQILSGQLEPGTRLPSTRTLSTALGVSRNTTALAYEMLLLEGYLESRVGDGTRVAVLPPLHGDPRQAPGSAAERGVAGTAHPPTATLSRRGQALAHIIAATDDARELTTSSEHVFGIGQPDVAAFPFQTWARLLARHAHRSLRSVALYQSALGYLPLREAIAAHIGVTRGVNCSPQQIVITAGAQGALDLIARVLLDPGDRVWVEDPGYHGARGALLAAGARLVPVPVDDQGIDVAAGQRLASGARLAVVTPSHQFPTAVPMTMTRRLDLLAWAGESNAWIVEDDYDSEYRYGGRPLEALQGLDSSGRVLYVGTFSKVLFPSLRLGYVVVHPALVPGFLAAQSFAVHHLPLVEQMALADFIAEGHFARHLRKMRHLYLERRNTLVDALTQQLRDIMRVVVPTAGMHLVAWLPSALNVSPVVEQAAAHGLRILPISQFAMCPPQRDGLMFGFAGASPDRLRAGVYTLTLAMRAASR
jgi:GntR family transcriptional regulator / MocR family aminotransferase